MSGKFGIDLSATAHIQVTDVKLDGEMKIDVGEPRVVDRPVGDEGCTVDVQRKLSLEIPFDMMLQGGRVKIDYDAFMQLVADQLRVKENQPTFGADT